MSKKEKALLWCILITLVVMGIEIYYGYAYNSLMLIGDGLHMLSHASSLFVSLLAIWIAKNKSKERQVKIEARAALINGISLVGFIGFLLYESVERILAVELIELSGLLIVALVGLGTNLLTAIILWRAGVEDLNTKSAFLHMLADTFSSVAIVIGCVVIYYTNWFVIDPILSIVVALIIAKWSYGLLRDARAVLVKGEALNNHHHGHHH